MFENSGPVLQSRFPPPMAKQPAAAPPPMANGSKPRSEGNSLPHDPTTVSGPFVHLSFLPLALRGESQSHAEIFLKQRSTERTVNS